MKILLRSNMPFHDERNSISDILLNDFIGNNIGNVLFQNSVSRWLMTEDTEIQRIATNRRYSDAEIDYFNSEFDMLILPLANALRADFVWELKFITDLVQRLTIPCAVIGIGIQRELRDTAWNFSFDEPAKDFFKAVLDKSVIVGVRGELTAHYLKNIGLTPEKDFTVIGCPSLFTYGYNLPTPDVKDLTPESVVSFNSTVQKGLYNYLEKEARKFKDYTYVLTKNDEIRNLYVGYPLSEKAMANVPDGYPIDFANDLVQNNRVVGFVDEYSWLNFLKTRDFSFGARIHGTIANILAGTPCHIIIRDNRTAELADYHQIPHTNLQDIKEDTDIFDLFARSDFSQIAKGHKQRVDYFVDFMDRNKVPHLATELMGSVTPFDRKYNLQQSYGELRHFVLQSPEEQQRRLNDYYIALRDKQKNTSAAHSARQKELSKELSAVKAENKALKKEMKYIKNTNFFKLHDKYHLVKDKFIKR